jgi:hypothetical protein
MNKIMFSNPTRKIKLLIPKMRTKKRYSIEFFHIYSDEVIGLRQIKSIDDLEVAQKLCDSDYDRVVLIDNYNPSKHTLTLDTVLKYLASRNVAPHYVAYEKDLVGNAQILLEAITDNKLRKDYTRYITKNQKYPCSLLTAAWYLTRLGVLENGDVIQPVPGNAMPYQPSTNLLNILPEAYESIEQKAQKIIVNSPFADKAAQIHNMFYVSEDEQASTLF